MENKMRYLILVLCVWLSVQSYAQTNEEVTKVYVVFKTHLDVGFTDLSSVVTERYIREFIPKAIEVSEKFQSDKSAERYVWTTGSWLIWKYLHSASPKEVKRMEAAIRRGDIVWNAVPYTVESETMNRDLFETCLLLSKKLDRKYGKQTIAAKMTDVPGHTRSIIDPMQKAGIRFLHIGVNPASPIPDVPAFCRWRDTEGNELILAYQQDYGTESILPNGKTVISINFTGDNHGPHSYEQVKNIYANLHKRYPKARVIGASFNEIAQELSDIRESLPVVTSEIGDTWIYGYGSAPIRMAKFRGLSALYSEWLRKGKINKESDEAVNFAVELGLIAEHTQGVDVKTHLRHWDEYDMDRFLQARSSGAFHMAEQSWKELDNYIGSAIACLPEELQKEALVVMKRIDCVNLENVDKKKRKLQAGDWSQSLLPGGLRIAGLSYQMFDAKDYDLYCNHYLRAHYDWALADFGKPGLDKSGAVSVSLPARVTAQSIRKEREGTRTVTELAFPTCSRVDSQVYPERMQVSSFVHKDKKQAEVSLSIYHKPAVRLPEAYWLSFSANDIVSVIAEKMGARVDLLDVVAKGNRQMHGIDRYIDVVTSSGTFRIWSETAFLVNVGEACGLNYSTEYPDKRGGIHFNLSNNLWGTNFTMWNEGSLTFRFRIELLAK